VKVNKLKFTGHKIKNPLNNAPVKKCIKCGRPLILGNTTSDINSKWCDACYYFD